MPKPLFQGVCASTITPFDADGRLQLDRLKTHIDWIIKDGAHALSPLGSSGEFPALELEDRKRVLDAVLEANAGRLPVVAGTHCYSTRHTIELSRHAEKAGADALLVIGSSLMVFSGFRFAKQAHEAGLPIAIVNRGHTRGDELAELKVEGDVGTVMTHVTASLASTL